MVGSRTDLLFIGVGGHAVAIDVRTGDEIWRTKLKTAATVTVHPVGARVFAGANGELFCLDAASGNILWHNKLPGLGLGVLTFGGSADAAVAYLAQQAANAAAAT
jgi:outer membrane protein assembly factor BamB